MRRKRRPKVRNKVLRRRIAKRLRERMQSEGISGNQLAGQSGCSQAMISLILRAERNVSAYILLGIAEALDVNLDYFVRVENHGSRRSAP